MCTIHITWNSLGQLTGSLCAAFFMLGMCNQQQHVSFHTICLALLKTCCVVSFTKDVSLCERRSDFSYSIWFFFGTTITSATCIGCFICGHPDIFVSAQYPEFCTVFFQSTSVDSFSVNSLIRRICLNILWKEIPHFRIFCFKKSYLGRHKCFTQICCKCGKFGRSWWTCGRKLTD